MSTFIQLNFKLQECLWYNSHRELVEVDEEICRRDKHDNSEYHFNLLPFRLSYALRIVQQKRLYSSHIQHPNIQAPSKQNHRIK